MTAMRIVLMSMIALTGGAALAACGEPQAEPAASPYAGGAQDAAQADPQTAPPAGGEPADADGLDPLEIAARDVCAVGDDGFVGALPEGAAFASRGPDARVHAAWNTGGERFETIIRTPALETEARLAFDGAVADFIRHNMTAGFDRTGLTGAFRFRDGRFCVVQTEDAVIAPFQNAVREAEAALEASSEG